MPTRRVTKRRSAKSTLPAAQLHYCATGEMLTDNDGRRLYGSTFTVWAVFDVPTRPSDLAAYWQEHRATIEAHARRLGVAIPWLQRRVEGEAC
ncbi:MAG: hypothetical protein IT177_22530 [Acidobacteria bacterium]|nr:hypothetical protein [Acidobacteriota bacterium]